MNKSLDDRKLRMMMAGGDPQNKKEQAGILKDAGLVGFASISPKLLALSLKVRGILYDLHRQQVSGKTR